MDKRAWKQLFFLATAVLTALMFWNLECTSRIRPAKQSDFSKEREIPEKETDQKKEKSVFSEKETAIRVLIRSDAFQSEYHETLSVQCLDNAVLETETGRTDLKAGEVLFFSETDEQEGTKFLLSGRGGEGIFSLTGLERGYENPVYSGTLQIQKTDRGYLVVNELPLEEYLKKVVPSEMPSAYPLEALKAQAVCARTYAVRQMEEGRISEFDADVDDSVQFQVYNNQPETASSTKAVEETKHLILTENGKPMEALYYSTSCGVDLFRDLSRETVFCSFLSMKNQEDYEWKEPWYRWNLYLSLDQLTTLAKEAGYGTLGEIRELSLGERESSGRLASLTIRGTNGEQIISGEYEIRKFLNPKNETLTLQNGEKAPELGMLPSAFFYLTPAYEETELLGYQITGGGYGHGEGLSQNGARCMAEQGMEFREILTYYYGELELDEILDTRD